MRCRTRYAHPNHSRRPALQAETLGDVVLLDTASPTDPFRTSAQLWAVWFTLLVSVSGAALEFLGGGVTDVGRALGSVALIDLVLLALPGRAQARWLPLTPHFYGVSTLR